VLESLSRCRKKQIHGHGRRNPCAPRAGAPACPRHARRVRVHCLPAPGAARDSQSHAPRASSATCGAIARNPCRNPLARTAGSAPGAYAWRGRTARVRGRGESERAREAGHRGEFGWTLPGIPSQNFAVKLADPIPPLPVCHRPASGRRGPV